MGWKPGPNPAGNSKALSSARHRLTSSLGVDSGREDDRTGFSEGWKIQQWLSGLGDLKNTSWPEPSSHPGRSHCPEDDDEYLVKGGREWERKG